MIPAGLRVLILPGWQGSGPEHWQSRWELRYGYQRVQQHDWMQPLRGDWMIQLEEALIASPVPVLLVAHSLGCHLVAAWAAHSGHTARVHAALLVAPPDAEDPALAPLHSWRPAVRQALPFPARMLASSNDPYCSLPQAAVMASDWDCMLIDAGPLGHINGESGLGDWPWGHRHLLELAGSSDQPVSN